VVHNSAVWGLYSGRVVSALQLQWYLIKNVLEAGKLYTVRIFHTDGTFESKAVVQAPGNWFAVGMAGVWTSIQRSMNIFYWENISRVKQFKVTDISWVGYDHEYQR